LRDSHVTRFYDEIEYRYSSYSGRNGIWDIKSPDVHRVARPVLLNTQFGPTAKAIGNSINSIHRASYLAMGWMGHIAGN
jgi:hypothetical protein